MSLATSVALNRAALRGQGMTPKASEKDPSWATTHGARSWRSRRISRQRVTYPRPPTLTAVGTRATLSESSPPINPSIEGLRVSTKRSVSTICSTSWLM